MEHYRHCRPGIGRLAAAVWTAATSACLLAAAVDGSSGVAALNIAAAFAAVGGSSGGVAALDIVETSETQLALPGSTVELYCR